MNKLFCVSIGLMALSACSQEVSQAVSPTQVKPQSVVQVEPARIDASSLTSSESYKLAKGAEKKEGKMDKGLLSGQLQVSLKTGFTVSLIITNNQSFAVPIQYRSGMTADLHLLDPQGNKIWAWSDTMMFTQALRDVVIPAGKVIPVRFTLPKDVLAQVKGKGYSLVGIYVGHATESSQQAMSDTRLSLDSYLN
ncbi:BsuPI-related putative proteinase inhibitor [Shewanella benthica]|uniref:BsuPI-related putative proteinase inhibitor n=1 Tax=Shewanella benthica TaxID=43661 RepID=UPI00187A54A1|nr:BsuPI-related putative proteinase inhibitor [Shewanella benthica]MBE7216194.1 proteinase inhibitor [Shewanella benthica]MCL1063065.1 BsuPI-related putative proteinase inhibitor [Shewanella benthica]